MKPAVIHAGLLYNEKTFYFVIALAKILFCRLPEIVAPKSGKEHFHE
jgi:hypothetical protein